MHRLFVAIMIPADIRKRLALMGCGIPGARWVIEEQMHLTLRFIGEVDGKVFQDVEEALGGVQADPFSLTLKGVGHFPPRGKPRILWVGMEKSEPLNQLQNRIDHCVRRAGGEPEERNFHAHVTLARLNNSPENRIGGFMIEHGLFRCEPFTVQEFHLFSSFLRPEGPIHRIEATYPLIGTPAQIALPEESA